MHGLAEHLLANPSADLRVLFVAVIAIRWFLVKDDRSKSEYILVAAVFAPIISDSGQSFADTLSALRPLKYDLYVFQLDRLLGLPGFRIGQVLAHSNALSLLAEVIYGSPPLLFVLIFTVYLYKRRAETVLAVAAIGLNLLLAPAFYLLFPVCGPKFAFPNFPTPPAQLHPHLLAIAAAPNGVPSIHMATALLFLWLLRHWRIGMAAGVIFAVMTVFTILGNGEHYLLDLIFAVPYTALVAWCSCALSNYIPSAGGLVGDAIDANGAGCDSA